MAWVGYKGPAQLVCVHPSPFIACTLQSCPVCPQAGGDRGAGTVPGNPEALDGAGATPVPLTAPSLPWEPLVPMVPTEVFSRGRGWCSLAGDEVKPLQARSDKHCLK